MRSLVAGPGPEAGVSSSEELGEESRRSAPEQIQLWFVSRNISGLRISL